jgi:hypothetical protein
MKIRFDMDYDKHKKGDERECSDEEGCALIGQGVASVLAATKPQPGEAAGVMTKPVEETKSGRKKNGGAE